MNLDDFKSLLGIGYRPNLWDIKFTFNANELFSSINDEITNYTNGQSNENEVSQKQKILINTTNNTINGLITKFQLPGYTLTESDSIFRFKNYPTVATKGGLGNIDILMDEYNIQYMFFKTLLSSMNNSTLLEYPKQYLFDTEFNIISPRIKDGDDRKIYTSFTFYNCYIISIGDINHQRTETTTIPTFNISINYEDYDYTNISSSYKKTNTTYPVPFATTEQTKNQMEAVERDTIVKK